MTLITLTELANLFKKPHNKIYFGGNADWAEGSNPEVISNLLDFEILCKGAEILMRFMKDEESIDTIFAILPPCKGLGQLAEKINCATEIFGIPDELTFYPYKKNRILIRFWWD